MTRVVLGIVVGLLVLGLVTAVLFARGDAEAQDALARHEAKLLTDRAGLAAIRRTRPPLLGPALEGNAWDEEIAVVRALAPDERAPIADALAPGEGAARVPVGGALRARLHGTAQRPCIPPGLTEPVVSPAFAWLAAHRVLEATARDDLAAGRVDDAIDLWRSMTVLAADLERTTHYLDVVVAQGMRARQLAVLGAVLATASGRAASWHRLAATLDAADALRPRTLDVLRVHDADLRTYLLDRAATTGWPSRIDQVWGRWPWQWSPRRRALRTLERREETTARLREILATPMPGWRAAVVALRPTLGTSGPRPEATLDDRRVDAAYVAFAPVAITQALLVRVAVALAEHGASVGALPPTLEALVPTYLSTVPACAITGQALHYDPATGRVWSVGTDGDDDGGRPVPRTDGFPELEAEGDLVIVVVPPARR